MKRKNKGQGRDLAKVIVWLTLWVLPVSCWPTHEGLGGSAPGTETARFYAIGHRGAAGLAPENTLAAISRALEIGVEAVELDVHLSADQVLVVHHDFRLNPNTTRTDTGQWIEPSHRPRIRDLTVAQLRRYEVGRLRPDSAYARRYPHQEPVDGERIPTLREVIRLLKGHGGGKTELLIEIKANPERPKLATPSEIIAESVIRLLRRQAFCARAFIMSFDWRCCMYVQRKAPQIRTVYLSHMGVRLDNIKPGQPGPSPWMGGLDIDDFRGSIPRAIHAAGGRYWAPFYRWVTFQQLEQAHRLGIRVFVWTPDSERAMSRMLEMGVDGIITNRPDILKSLLGRRK